MVKKQGQKQLLFGVSSLVSDEQQSLMTKCPPPVGYTQLQKTKSTFSSSSSNAATASKSTQQQQQLLQIKKQNKAMALAINPGKQMAMNAFMLWFSGSQLNLFSINTVSSAILTPITALMAIGNLFGNHAFEGVDTRLAKLAYVAINLLWLCIGLYKMSSMRLLPTTSADWTSKLVWKEMMESTSVPPSPIII